MGGRLVPGGAGEPRVLFIYENPVAGRITLHVSVLSGDAAPAPAAFRFARVGQTETFYWIEGSLGYALSGDLPRERLAQLADAVHRQLRPETLAP
jgi:anti-sigma factor RsiW